MVSPRFACVWLVLVFVCCACGASLYQLKSRAHEDLHCPTEEITTWNVDRRTLGARGCGREAIYIEQCSGDYHTTEDCTWVLNTDVRTDQNAAEPQAEAPSDRAELEEVRTNAGLKELRAFLFGKGWTLIARAVPKKDAGQARLLLRSELGTPTCEVKFVANGERLRVDATKHSVMKDYRNEWRFGMSYDDVAAMAAAQRVVGRYCDVEITLAQIHVEKLREFVMRIREELALDEEPAPAPAAPKGDGAVGL
jgi:hypothetical protein